MDYSKAWDLIKMQQEAAKIKKELENTLIEAEVDGLVITFNAEMKVEKVEFEDKSLIGDEKKLTNAIFEAINKWIKKSQEIAAQKMQWVMKSMWLNMPDGMNMPWM